MRQQQAWPGQLATRSYCGPFAIAESGPVERDHPAAKSCRVEYAADDVVLQHDCIAMEQDDSRTLSTFDKVHLQPVDIHEPAHSGIPTFCRARGEADDKGQCCCEGTGDKQNLLIHFFLRLATQEELSGSTDSDARSSRVAVAVPAGVVRPPEGRPPGKNKKVQPPG